MTFPSNVLDFNSPVSTGVNAAINTALDAAALVEEREAAPGLSRRVGYRFGMSAQGAIRLAAGVRFMPRAPSGSSIAAMRRKRRLRRRLIAAGFTIERGTEAHGLHCLRRCVPWPLRRHHSRRSCDRGADLSVSLGKQMSRIESGWKKIEKVGLRAAYPVYFDQCQLYMAYLGLDENPALFTAENADTCHFLALTVAVRCRRRRKRRAIARCAVIRSTQAGELLPRITDKGPSDWRCKMCSHSEFCWSLPD